VARQTVHAWLAKYEVAATFEGGADRGGVEIDAEDVTGRVLHLAIQAGVATPAQQEVLDQVGAYAKSKGVTLIVSEVP
jgi:hypothetical protein